MKHLLISWQLVEIYNSLMWLRTFAQYYIYIIGQVGRMFANGSGNLDSIASRIIPKTLKIVLDTSLLSNIRYVSRVKWSNPKKEVAPPPTPWCGSYWKGKLLVTLDYGRQHYFIIFTQPLRSGRIWHKVSFWSAFYQFWIQSLPSPRLVASPRLKNLVCPTIYP